MVVDRIVVLNAVVTPSTVTVEKAVEVDTDVTEFTIVFEIVAVVQRVVEETVLLRVKH